MSDSVQALQPVVDDGLLRSIKDCTAGSVGGILQVLVGQPFDTVKVRLQTAPIPRPGEPPMYASTMDGFRKVAAEGWGTFYKGTTTPLLGVGLCVSIQFVVLEDLKRRFAHANLAAGSAPALTTSQLYTAGALAGLANSVVSGPVEHIRTRLQVQSSSHPLYSGPGDCIKQIWRAHGLPGLYKAQATTALRELQGYGAYFALYETLVQRECAASGKPREDLDTWRVCTYGALAGYAMWFTVYPIDVIKSKLQTDGFSGKDRRYSSALDCARKTWVEAGFPGFWRGIVPCLLRAAPANAATFLGFEMAMRMIQ